MWFSEETKMRGYGCWIVDTVLFQISLDAYFNKAIDLKMTYHQLPRLFQDSSTEVEGSAYLNMCISGLLFSLMYKHMGVLFVYNNAGHS